MGLQEVKEEVLDRAQKESQAIIAEAQKEAERIRKEAEARIREYRQKAEEAARYTLEIMEKRELAQAEFDGRKALLKKKRDSIEAVMKEVSASLAELPDKKREEYLRRLLDKASKEIDVATVFVNPKDRPFFQKMKNIECKTKESMLGGLIAQTGDGKVSIDERYDTFLDDLGERHLPELSKLLFK